jgi:hypothetical protein
MRKSTFYITGLLILGGVLIFLLSVHPKIGAEKQRQAMESKIEMVRVLRLTDLSLFTEARYTRHLSQADLYSAFQDHPMSFEHFPSGSLTKPPAFFKR